MSKTDLIDALSDVIEARTAYARLRDEAEGNRSFDWGGSLFERVKRAERDFDEALNARIDWRIRAVKEL